MGENHEREQQRYARNSLSRESSSIFMELAGNLMHRSIGVHGSSRRAVTKPASAQEWVGRELVLYRSNDLVVSQNRFSGNSFPVSAAQRDLQADNFSDVWPTGNVTTRSYVHEKGYKRWSFALLILSSSLIHLANHQTIN